MIRRLLRRRPRRRTVLAAALALACGLAWLRFWPLPDGLVDDRAGASTVVVDRRGVVLYEALSGDGTRGATIAADALPPWVVAATVAAEDRRFWSHPGVDPIAVVRAARSNVAGGRVLEGGSTITQQVAKLLLNRRNPARHRGWAAKIHEAIIALRLEHRFTKRELLAMYLTLASYGNQISGIDRASRAYFGAPPSLLTPAQAAFLAGLPQRPSGFNPYRNREAALSRQRAVLRRMEAAGTLTPDQAREAREERLSFTRALPAFIAPHFAEMVLAHAGDPRPPRIETTLDAGLQADVTGIIEQHRPLLRRHGAGNVAVVVFDNRTGEWLAWEGSGDYFDEGGGAINGAVAPRQPGSALKPFTYALAFEDGYSPASVLADIPSSFPTADPGVVYQPRNYDGRFRGPLLARSALAGSENVPAVALASAVGIPNLVRFLGRAGLSTLDRTAAHYGLGLTLGNAEVRLDELVAAYAAFARSGEWIEPAFVARSAAQAPPDAARLTRRLVSPRTAFWITDILSDPEAREYIFGPGGSLEFPFHVAAKTGTSQSYHDNWTIGYSRHVTVGVWVGNFDRTPLRNSSGVTGAGPIFQSVMLAAERRVGGATPGDASIVAAAPDTTPLEICTLSGGAANAWCPAKRREWVASDAALSPCSWHHLSDEGLLTILPAEYQAWARDAGIRTAADRPPIVSGPSTRSQPVAARFAIANPAEGATYLIDPTLRREFQTLSLRVVAAAPGRVDWTINGRAIGSAASTASLEWPLAPGRHLISARDGRGRTAEATIVVR